MGNVPTFLGMSAFSNDTHSTIYYLPGTTGWGSTLGGRPTVLWNPQMLNDGKFGARTNRFGFTISGTTNLTLLIQACTNLTNPLWVSVSTNTLTNGSSYFSDFQWTNHPTRYYRLASPW